MCSICLQTNNIQNERPVINMTNWMRNQAACWYNAVSVPMAATHDAFPGKLQSVCEADSLMYN